MTETTSSVRACPGCGARLTVYNPGPLCFVCQKKGQDQPAGPEPRSVWATLEEHSHLYGMSPRRLHDHLTGKSPGRLLELRYDSVSGLQVYGGDLIGPLSGERDSYLLPLGGFSVAVVSGIQSGVPAPKREDILVIIEAVTPWRQWQSVSLHVPPAMSGSGVVVKVWSEPEPIGQPDPAVT